MDPRPLLASRNVAAMALSALMKLDAGQQVEAIVQTQAEALLFMQSEKDCMAWLREHAA
jgi:hypothetical protein